ncbi:MAG: FixH family protein [Alphaproteobacteria bacterium]|nr:FixH family protein [Alphaproteobacteria bacterium]MBL6937737.1 FixH family protein [Alphaproteobacteria bacterium]MBL7099075.1 FixH family protein [Alphaproteobacteria bacterium]
MTGTLTGRGVLVWLSSFFAVIIAVNVYFIVMSVQTFSGEDEEKPYLQGIEYNDTLARRAEQQRLGWQATVSATRLSSGHVRIAVVLHDRAANPLSGVSLTAELRHPSDENRDQALRLASPSPGRYEVDAGAISRGRWDLLVRCPSVKTPFEAMRQLWVP